MEREILFRGKSLHLGSWVYGFYSHDQGVKHHHILQFDEFGLFEVDPETVGIFTGLTDKNGVNIFEGDKLEFEDEQKSVVKWMQGGLTIEADFGDYDLTTVGWAIDILGQCEIIGNIHDNPELL